MDTELVHGAYFFAFDDISTCPFNLHIFATHLFNVKYISSFYVAFLLNICVYTFRRFLLISAQNLQFFLPTSLNWTTQASLVDSRVFDKIQLLCAKKSHICSHKVFDWLVCDFNRYRLTKLVQIWSIKRKQYVQLSFSRNVSSHSQQWN